MKLKVSGSQIVIIVVAAIGSVLIAHYEELLPRHWQTYMAPDGTFSLDLPGKPTIETNQAPLESGGTITLHSINVAVGSSAYTCTYVELENASQKSPDQVLESARDGSLRNVQGTLITQNQLTVQGFPGLQFQAHARGNSLMDSRMVLAGNRLYMIMAVAADGQNAQPKTVERMFDSFKVNSK
jgi:hypothetical protein